MMDDKTELLRFLDSKVFNPILKARVEDYPQNARAKLEHVQRSTESEKERFRNYRNAEEIRENYLRDLSSRAAKRIDSELEDLKLPRLPDVKDEFPGLFE